MLELIWGEIIISPAGCKIARGQSARAKEEHCRGVEAFSDAGEDVKIMERQGVIFEERKK